MPHVVRREPAEHSPVLKPATMAAFEKVPSEMNFPLEEKKILEFWREKGIFRKSLAQSAGKPPFVFYEGPPTANGLPHNGHVLTRVMKDIFPRYKTMRGYHVGRKAGWDTHGLPVEVEVEKELRIHGKAAIEEYGVEPFIAKCIDSVFRYTSEWEQLTDRIAFWVDLDDAYVTYHKSFVESVWWALSELFQKGLLYQGHKVVWWWAQGGTALSAAEVGQGYKPVDDPSVYVRFKLRGEAGTSLVAWTTTPWTLPSNMYAAVKPDLDYVVVKHGDEKLVVAAGLREALAKKLKTELVVERTLKGSKMEGWEYDPPFTTYSQSLRGTKPAWKVVLADFVTLDTGTGIVHVAPAFGEDDYGVLKTELAAKRWPADEGPICAIGPDGKFLPDFGDTVEPKLTGVWVKDADKPLIEKLSQSGTLLHKEQYRHDYPFCPRADQDPLIQFARPAWYIRTTEKIDQAIANSRAVQWMPEHIKEGRMGDFLGNNVDWALSRERYWGTPLNIWINDVTGKMEAPPSVDAILKKNPKAFDHFHEARKKDPKLNEHLIVHKPWIDQVTWQNPGEEGTYRRVPEVIDCWFDSGCMPFAQWGFPHAPGSVEKFRENFPANFISEAIDQTRGWFYSLLMISTLVFDDECQKRFGVAKPHPHPYETCIVLGHVCDKEGKKESKSKGNYTPPEIVFDEVKMDFAVVSGKAEAGKVFVAQEDLDGLDLQPGAKVTVKGPKGSVTLAATPQKGLRRRVAIVTDADLATVGAKPTTKANPMPAEVPRLPADERVALCDPTTPAPGADAFRWFFYAASPPWSNTRHSLSNVRTLQKEFLVKLRNTYSFFVIYANIDGWDPLDRPSHDPAFTELDRWISSELALTAQGVTKDLDGYDVYAATQKLIAFVDALSNWYVRRSRSRFWKSGMDADKTAAYQTLYGALVTLSKLVAPFTPYAAEDMYQNLVRRPRPAEPESVHLVPWPTFEGVPVDAALSAKMRAVRELVSLGLSVRTNAKLKVRQPLRAAHVILSQPKLEADVARAADMIKEELNVQDVRFVPPERGRDFVEYQLKPNFRTLGQRGLGKEAQKLKATMGALPKEKAGELYLELLAKGEIEIDGVKLSPDDVEVSLATKEGFAASGARVGVVALETTLDDELRELGFLRELQSKVQAARKEIGLDFADRITLVFDAPGARADGVLAKYTEALAAEVLATRVDRGTAASGARAFEVDVDGEPVRFAISLSAKNEA